MTEATFPGGSKSRVTRAGEAIRQGSPTNDDLLVIEEWRAAHRRVLNTFQAILRSRTRGRTVHVAQRHKRKLTIFDKLNRFTGMQLARMDDVAGCRLIFNSIKEMQDFRSELHPDHQHLPVLQPNQNQRQRVVLNQGKRFESENVDRLTC